MPCLVASQIPYSVASLLKVKTGATPADQLAELAGDEVPWYSPNDIGGD